MKRFTRAGHLAMAPQAWGLDYSPAERSPAQLFATAGDTAVVTIRGPLTQHEEWSWWCCDNYDAIRARVAAALESPAKSLLLYVDSPGGDAAGNFELAAWIRSSAADAGKKVYAFTDGVAASAAYAIACAAEKIYVAQTARVGSIGTIMMCVDQTAMDQQFGLRFQAIASGTHKADGNPHVALTDEAIGEMKSQIDVYASMFFDLVAGARPLTADAIKALEARVFIGANAVEIGLADAVTTFDSLLAMVASGSTELSGAKETDQMDFEEMLAALKEKAEGEGEEADKARKMLKALEGDGKDAKSEEEGEGDGKKDEKSDKTDEGSNADEEEDAENAAASTAVGEATTIAALSAQIQALSGQVSKISGVSAEQERKTLLAQHPTLAKELVGVVMKKNKAGAFVTPMSTVRAICKGAAPAPAKKSAAATAVAAAAVKPTAGEGQSGTLLGGVTRLSADADQMDAAFGLKAKSNAITLKAGVHTFNLLTADEARARAKELSAKTPALPAGKEVA